MDLHRFFLNFQDLSNKQCLMSPTKRWPAYFTGEIITTRKRALKIYRFTTQGVETVNKQY